MTAPVELHMSHTHLYPGARGTVGCAAPDGPVTVCFADGTRVPAELDGTRLRVGDHETARGARIAAKTWRIALDSGSAGGPHAIRVTARLT